MEKLKKESRDGKIAFSAGLMESGNSGQVGPFTTEITLTYRNVFTNIGNAYNPITSAMFQNYYAVHLILFFILLFASGVFTAPPKGAYMFIFSVFGHSNPLNPSAASIMKNGEKVVMAHGYQDQYDVNSSKGVVLILEVGDVVYVRLWSEKWIYDDENNHNTFSGYLLFPLREQELCRK
ncbi:complement C1q-like protein 4 [Puntigrus tetrazona]|uniref:complement C1q-like protein 4 n=1 Tax=Puntigrus tetrazona TaxID=1606681 RepID=UPI001C899CBF|nr:complement C1q-like protein 4 [Puntigrus tetrazona]